MQTETHWTSAPERLPLAPNEVHVWRARLDLPDQTVSRYLTFLSSQEVERANRFVFPIDRNRFIAGRGILRELLAKYLQRPPASISIQKYLHGKPFLEPQMGLFDVFFNISHSQGAALLAFSSTAELGVDIEKIRPNVVTEEIAERYFSPEELRELRTLAPELQTVGFFYCWTRKEAYVKASGEGLRIPLDSFSVSLTPGQPAILKSADQSKWSLFSLNPGEGFAGACVAAGKTGEIRLFQCGDWSEEKELSPGGQR